jgi:ERF superfamily
MLASSTSSCFPFLTRSEENELALETLPAIQVALAAVKKAVGAVKKEERNQQQGFNFRGVDSVVNAAAPALNEHGVIVLPEVQDFTYEVVEIGRNKTAMGHVILKVKFIFTGPLGDTLCAVTIGEAMDSGDKAFSKAHSIAYRIALLQVLNLPTDEPDPDHDIYERAAEPASKAPSRPARSQARTAPDNGSAAASAAPETLAELVSLAEQAGTAEDLNALFKKAGAAGLLVSLVAHPGTGEKMTYQQYLYERNDAIKSSGGNGSAEKSRTAAAR